MGARGRKSPKDVSVVQTGPVITMARPDPPDDLTDEQANEWRAVVDALPADWFPRETWGLLAQYCRHVVAARRVAQLVAAAEADAETLDIEDYDRLLKMQEREGRAMSSLASRMRINQQATIDKRKKKPSSVKKPWETD